MKNLFLFFILISGLAFGQKFKEKISNIPTEEKLKQTLTELVSITGKPYEFLEVDKNRYTVYNYVDKDNILQIFTYSYQDGQNKDLEIKGVKKWGIKSMTGNFLTLFNVWHEYINPDITREEILKKGMVYLNDENPFVRMYKGNNSENFWILEF